jgi:hypothetical protein
MRDETMRNFPDMPSLVAFMNKARETGQEDLRAQYEEMYERAHGFSDGWYTHAPLLAAVVASAPPGPVLEVGVGRGSSTVLVEMCKAMGRELIGIDSDAGWLAKMADLDYPRLLHMPDWTLLADWLGSRRRRVDGGQWVENPFAVAFVDHGPGEARLPVVKMLRGHAEQIVVHDTHNPGYLIGLDAYLDTFRYRHDYTLMPSCTSVVSDVRTYAGAR